MKATRPGLPLTQRLATANLLVVGIALEIKREQRAILFVITLHIGAEDY
jgi:hypothetical protein